MKRNKTNIPVFYALVDMTDPIISGALSDSKAVARIERKMLVKSKLGVNINQAGTRAVVKLPASRQVAEQDLSSIRLYSESELEEVRAVVRAPGWGPEEE